MSTENTTRKGKIATMPEEIRKELNERLRDGAQGPALVTWLNGLQKVQEILSERWNGDPINEQNVSAWRNGGYRDWLMKQERLNEAREMSAFAVDLVKATGLNISDGAAAIAAGNLLARMQGGVDPDEEYKLIKRIAILRDGDHAVHEGHRKDERLQIDKEKTAIKKSELALNKDKFKRTLCEKILEAAASAEVQKIVASDKPKTVKLEQLRIHFFGADEPDEGADFLKKKGLQ